MLKRLLAIVCALAVVASMFSVWSITYAQSATPTPAEETPEETEEDTEEGAEGAEVEETLDMADVPDVVIFTAEKAAELYAPGATWEGVQFDPEGDVPAYEFAGVSEAGEELEIDVQPDGMLEEVEVVISDADVSAEALDLLELLFPESQVDLIELSVRPTKLGLTTIYFEFEIVTADGLALDIEIDEAGTKLLAETVE